MHWIGIRKYSTRIEFKSKQIKLLNGALQIFWSDIEIQEYSKSLLKWKTNQWKNGEGIDFERLRVMWYKMLLKKYPCVFIRVKRASFNRWWWSKMELNYFNSC